MEKCSYLNLANIFNSYKRRDGKMFRKGADKKNSKSIQKVWISCIYSRYKLFIDQIKTWTVYLQVSKFFSQKHKILNIKTHKKFLIVNIFLKNYSKQISHAFLH